MSGLSRKQCRERKFCPVHGEMELSHTRFGGLYVCEAPDCTMRCWQGPTSLPGDQQTRDARHALHEMFDPIWNDEAGPFSQGKRPNKRGVRRDRAYWWLANTMGITKDAAHFGMFTLEQCQRAKAAIERELLAAAGRPQTEEQGKR